MIKGESSVNTKVLEKAVVHSILAGSRRATEKNRQLALESELNLLRYHREHGHQSLIEHDRSIKTERTLIRHNRRWAVERGYFSKAEAVGL